MKTSAQNSKTLSATEGGPPVVFCRTATLDLAAESNTPPENCRRLLERMREDARRLSEALFAPRRP